MAKAIKDLIKDAKKLGIEVTGDESAKDLAEVIKIKKAELEDAKKVENKKIEDDKKLADAKKKGVIYYDVKVKAYKNGEDIVEIGLYRTKKEVKRFGRMPKDVVERFDGKIPAPKLHEIAKRFRVSLYEEDGETVREDKEIINELVKEL